MNCVAPQLFLVMKSSHLLGQYWGTKGRIVYTELIILEMN